MMVYVLLLVIAVVFWFLPKYLKLVIFIINIFVPDPIPYVDELIMGLMLLKDIAD